MSIGDGSVDSLRPTQTVNLPNDLSLIPRLKLFLTIHRADKSLNPLNDWQFKTSLITYLKTTLSVTLPEHEINLKRSKNPNTNPKRRHDPISRGTLFIRDLGFLEKGDGEVGVVEKRVLEWRKFVVEKLDGIDLSLEGVRFRLSVEVPASEDFETIRKELEEEEKIYGFGGRRGTSRSGRQQPDTIVLRGVPSRWFAEPRVSSKPSILVSHTIFSAFGKIRTLDVAEDDDVGKDEEEGGGDIVSGLQCKIVVRFEKYRDFYNALKVLCGRSLQKEGSRLMADYEVTWDKDGLFRNTKSDTEEKNRWMPSMASPNYRSEAPKHHRSRISRFSPDDTRTKRFKEY